MRDGLEAARRELYVKAIKKLLPHGWMPCGDWLFEKGGKIYDLSAADISQHKRIEREGLFLV